MWYELPWETSTSALKQWKYSWIRLRTKAKSENNSKSKLLGVFCVVALAKIVYDFMDKQNKRMVLNRRTPG